MHFFADFLRLVCNYYKHNMIKIDYNTWVEVIAVLLFAFIILVYVISSLMKKIK